MGYLHPIVPGSRSPRRARGRLRPAALAASLLWAATPPPAAAAETGAPQTAPAVLPVREEALRHDVAVLASDEFEGRRVGTPGLARAAAHVEARMRALGLLPAGDAGGYRQRFEVTTGTELGADNRMSLRLPDGTAQELAVGRDFLPLSFSDTSALEGGDLAFAGYGIEAPDLGYDDYRDLDVRGKVIVVLRDEPQEDDKGSVFAGELPSQYSDLRFKALTARDKGAAGMIFVTGPLRHPDDADELIPLRNDYSGVHHGLPAVCARRGVLEPLLRAAGLDLAAWQEEVDRTLEPHGMALPGAVDLRTDLHKTTADTWNVVGMLRGSDPRLAEEAVVVGAHFDHLGLGGPESLAPERYGEVHNGADDNASGTAAMLAVAEAMARGGPPRRSLVFAAFSGEEEGLLGSSHYVRAPAVPLDRTVFMLNMDMVGRLEDDPLVVSGVGTGSGIEETVAAAAATLGLATSKDLSGFGASDQTVFYSREIPVLFLFTGAHSEYHKPEDDAQLIDYRGLARVASLAFRLVRTFADADEPPAYRKVDVGKPLAATGRGYGPYFGTIPDFGESPVPGVLLSGVREGSPAERAGLRGGDVVVEFAGVTVANLHDYTYALRKHRPGDEVQVVVIRDGERRTFTAVLEKRTE
jgi:hypothetical protein